MEITTVLNVKNENCGIKSFDENLRNALNINNVKSSRIDFSSISNEQNGIFVFHYVPSLYTDSDSSFMKLWSKLRGTKIILIHGIYPNRIFDHRSETVNPYYEEQIKILLASSNAIISLSESTLSALKTWTIDRHIRNNIVLNHPGLLQEETYLLQGKNHKYVFLGGIIRPKKDISSERLKRLLKECENKGINVWLHKTNMTLKLSESQVAWKTTHGKMNLSSWTKTLFDAEWVLCPYDTEVQTVSGIIAESISLGTRVLTTSFPFALEMYAKYPDYIVINNDLTMWIQIMQCNLTKLPIPSFPKWNEFACDLIHIVEKINANNALPPTTAKA